MKYTILHTEASTGWGGQEIRTFREAVGMRERGHRILISASRESGLLKHAELAGFRSIPFEFKRRSFISTILFFKKLIEKEAVGIINTHSSKDSWLVLPAARIAANRPLVLRTRHLSTGIHPGFQNRFLYNQLPHHVITTAQSIKTRMVNINGFDAGRIISIPTGVDTDIFNPETVKHGIKAELGIEESAPLAGAVSVIRSWKGLDYLVRAVPMILKEIPEAKFIIAGDGIHKKTLEKTLEKTGAGDSIYLLGHREDVENIMSSIDILVHPSYANEGIPQAVLQAMAMRRPVIASDLPSLEEVVIDGKTGVIVPAKNPEAIAKAVIRLFSDKALSGELGENGRRLALRSYSFKAMIDKLEKIYDEYSSHRNP